MMAAPILAIVLSLQGSIASLQESPPSEPEHAQQTPSSSDKTETPQAGQSQPEPQTAQPQPEQDEQPEKPKETPPSPENNKGNKKVLPCSGPKSSGGNCGKGQRGGTRKVIREGGAPEPVAQLVPGMTPEQAVQHRQTTEQYLKLTEENLHQLAGRALIQSQQDTVSQIRNYMSGARSALDDGDLTRARILAFKAHLLASDLVKH